jgi:hypothetical protein
LRNQSDPRNFVDVQEWFADIKIMQVFFSGYYQQADTATCANSKVRPLERWTLDQIDTMAF